MTHVERFMATVERRPVDRPCTWMGIPTPAALPRLLRHFAARDAADLAIKLDDDIVPVELPYHSPTSNAVYAAFDFRKEHGGDEQERTLTSPGVFEDQTDRSLVDRFNWPDPAKFIDPAECRRVVEQVPPDRTILGVVWSAHFQDACAAFGMENAMMTMMESPAMFQAVIDRIVTFYLRANEIFLSATRGRLHAVLIGNDFGCQTGLIVSGDMVRRFAFPGTAKLIQQIHSYGLKVMHHSCGSIRPLIPDLIELGADIIHPIQALAAGMEAEGLKRDFGNRVSFCGGIDAQHLLVNGTPEQVREAVWRLRSIFPTGLIVSPSHEAILPDVPPENLAALFQAAHARAPGAGG